MKQKNKFIATIFTLLLSGLCYYILSFYEKGDQVYYRTLYLELGGANFNEIFLLAFNIVGSSEPISIMILWLGAQLGLSKDLYISLWNFILLFGILQFCIRSKSGWMVLILMLLNFYIWVMLLSAERLKFSFILITYAFILYRKNVTNKMLLLFSVGAHFQSLIFIICLSVYKTNYIKFITKKTNYLIIIPAAILMAYSVNLLFSENILRKYEVYSGSGAMIDLINPAALFIVSLFTLNSRQSAVRIFVAIIPFFYIFGADRLTMIYFMLIFFILGIEENLNKPVFRIALFYFTLKTILFVTNVYIFGTGFV